MKVEIIQKKYEIYILSVYSPKFVLYPRIKTTNLNQCQFLGDVSQRIAVYVCNIFIPRYKWQVSTGAKFPGTFAEYVSALFLCFSFYLPFPLFSLFFSLWISLFFSCSLLLNSSFEEA